MCVVHKNDQQDHVELASLLAGIVMVDPVWDRKITGIALDSRQVKKGDLFLACKGDSFDGCQFIDDAIARGAVAILTESDTGSRRMLQETIPIFYASDLRQKIGIIASRFYGHPSRRMHIIGITGTNGKTSCSHFIAQALNQQQQPCAIIGTVGSGLLGSLKSTGMTTPDAITLQALLAEYEHQGIRTVSMEVSSHALAQDRVKHIEIQTAIFTNLTRDHLDYHKTMDEYAAAKVKLFEKFGLRTAIVNIDDDLSERIMKIVSPPIQLFTYSLEQDRADVYASDIELNTNGIKARVYTPWGIGVLQSSLLGRFNLSNLLATLTCLGSMGIKLDEALTRLEKIQGVLGRMQVIQQKGFPTIVIDYAHTPDALQNALLGLREHVSGDIFCLFGCGGDRDQGKRPLMGKIAEFFADKVIVTDDNPRHEDPEEIVNQIVSGMQDPSKVQIEHDRRKALILAIDQARTSDCILLAGKGHEDYQQIGDEFIVQSDQEIVKSVLFT